MRQFEIIRIERVGTQWYACDVNDRATGVRIDAAVMAAVRQGPTWAEGYILGVHGLAQEDCKDFDQQLFNALGVASQLKGFSPPPGVFTKRIQLTPEGRIQFDRN